MKTLLFSQWNLFRMLRLIAGVLIAVQGIYLHDWLLSIAGIAFTLLALFNISCCANGSCGNTVNTSKNKQKEIEYEEVV